MYNVDMISLIESHIFEQTFYDFEKVLWVVQFQSLVVMSTKILRLYYYIGLFNGASTHLWL